MSDWTIYHNPRCSKSRQTLELLEAKGIQPKIVEYLKTPPSEVELKSILQKLNMEATALVRKKEKIIKDENIDISSNAAALKAMSQTPSLIERPIVIKNDKAVVGRPPENINLL